MKFKTPANPLLNVLRAMAVEEQHEFADLAGTTRNYLYQLGMRERTPKANLTQRIVAASHEMYVKTLGRTPKLTFEQIASIGHKRYDPLT